MIMIRKATQQDAEIASRIICICYEGFGETDDFPGGVIAELKKCRGTAEHVAELITNENFFVADEKNLLKGVVSIKDNEITKLYIDPQYQGKGLGRRLFTHAEAFIKAKGYEDMFAVTATLAAVPFYEKMGMVVSQTRTIDKGPCIGMTSIVLRKSFREK